MALWKKNLSSVGIYNESYNLPLENNYPALSLCGIKFYISIHLITGSYEETNLLPIKSSILLSVQFIVVICKIRLIWHFWFSRSWALSFFQKSMFPTNLQSLAQNMGCEVFHCSGFPKKNRWIDQILNFKLHDFC